LLLTHRIPVSYLFILPTSIFAIVTAAKKWSAHHLVQNKPVLVGEGRSSRTNYGTA